MVFKAAALRAALIKKGFRHERNTNDEFYYFYCDGKKTSIWTKVSMGKGEDIRDTLAGKIKRQLHLSNQEEVTRFVACPMTAEEYLQLLRTRGAVVTC